MNLMRWDDSYSVGNDTVDLQHQKLFDLVNKLILAIQGGMARSALGNILEEMVDYVEYHFRFEEELFAEHPEAAAHRKQHADFARKTMDFARRFNNGDTVIDEELLSYLVDWLNNHTLNLDRRFFAELKGS